MASSSTSSVKRSFKYDVFLSFRGEDTRNTFVGHLYNALQHKSIHTYKDDERIQKGKRISDELIKSIQDSRFHIIVFSKNYASSSWCLEELVQIIECQKTEEQTAYPVFYDVEPSEVRKQSVEFGQVFAKHENEEAVGKWRKALEEAASLAGWELKNTVDGNEAKFIQKIVEEISLELRSNNFSVDEKLVGMEARIRDVVSSLELGINDVRMIGIKGMGGGGKTTLARAVFDKISIQFEGSSFVENVREISNGSLFGLKSLQERILSNVLNDRDITVDSVYDGKKMMKKRMCSRKVLVVLDDVDHIDQLNALAGELNWFNEGSRVIITTRDEQVLVAHRVSLICNVNLLSHMEAICLFSRYAFGRESPIKGYGELSRQVACYAAGLPLTITVLGSFLCGKNELEWKDAIERLKTIPLKETLQKLELSYKGLEEDYKEIFLDVACIMKGWRKEQAIIALESCRFHARNGLRVLEQKSLITISRYGQLDMHDHIEEMGKNIVRRLHPNEPNKHSRLWIKEEIEDILSNGMGSEATTCIQLSMCHLNAKTIMKGLGNMKNLRFLKVHSWDHGDFNRKSYEVSQNFPNALQYMSWKGYPFRSLPATFQANNLVGLDMCGGRIVQFWEKGETKVLKKLRFLNFEYSELKSLDLGLTPNLEKLNLKDCVELVELHIPVEYHLKLISLDLGSSKLRTLDLRGTPNLENVRIGKCFDLVELHIPIECLKLRSLDLDSTKLRTLDLRGAPNLETLSVRGCYDLVELDIPRECLQLKSINLSCPKLRSLNLGWSLNIETLNLEKCKYLVELDIPRNCPQLKSLNLNCPQLRSFNLDDLLLPKLENLDIKKYSELKTLDLGRTPNLKSLHLKKCSNLVELRTPTGGLKNLIHLESQGFLRFTDFEILKNGGLPELKLFVKSVDICLLHPDSNFPKFQFECLYKEDLPSSIGNIEKLISVGFSCACTDLESVYGSICGLQHLTKFTLHGSIPEVPKDLDRLQCLEKLTLWSTSIKHLPNSILFLKHLKILRLIGCKLLEKLPEDLCRLECLEMLVLTECIVLRDIPNNICTMKSLKYFYLGYCKRVKELPEELGRLECLEELDIRGTCINHLPQSVLLLKKGLRIVGSIELLELYKSLPEIKTTQLGTHGYIDL